MDQFFQTLRKIQKKERSNGTLARVEDSFYKDIHKYLDKLRKSAGNDPFSDEYYLLKDTQRIATEICERREHKITDAAVVNIHRSYHLFTGNPKFDLVDTTPLNLTTEEEKFYFSLIDALKDHRKSISLEKLTEEQDVGVHQEPAKEVTHQQKTTLDTSSMAQEPVLDRIDEISKAKVIKDETPQVKKEIPKPKPKKAPLPPNDEFLDSMNPKDEFVDLDAQKLAKDSQLTAVLMFDEIDSIIGVDEKIYGPFRSQDIVVMPMINAKIFVKNHKGRIIKI